MYCPKCGSKNDDNAAFCSGCGEKLNAPQAAEAAKETMVGATTATGSVAAGDGSTAKAAKKTGRTIGIIFAIVIVVAVVVTAIMTGGFGLMGPAVKGSVNDYSWDELSKVSAEISKASDENGAIETAKKYNLTTANGKLDGIQVKDFQLKDGSAAQAQIAGFWHDDKTGGGKAGITFIFKDAIAEHDMNSDDTNAGGWKDSQMRSWLASDVMDMLPDDLKNALVEVDKRTNNVGETESISSVSTTADKLWLYSFVELCGNVSESGLSSGREDFVSIHNAEGSQYKLYRDMGVKSNGSSEILVKWLNGGKISWWERSPDPGSSDCFFEVYTGDYPYHYRSASALLCVVPGFCV